MVSVKLDDPEFEGSTRAWLGNTEVRTCVGRAVQEHLSWWLEHRPESAAVVIRVVHGARTH